MPSTPSRSPTCTQSARWQRSWREASILLLMLSQPETSGSSAARKASLRMEFPWLADAVESGQAAMPPVLDLGPMRGGGINRRLAAWDLGPIPAARVRGEDGGRSPSSLWESP